MSGYLATVLAFLLWGFFPLYWMLFQTVDAFELIAHRVLWGWLCLLPFLRAKGWRQWQASFRNWREMGLAALGAILLMTNWTVYIWAVLHGLILQASLGYFLVPLFNVACGRLFFGERLRPAQRGAVALAALGVAGMVIAHGEAPTVALIMAGSWGFYALLKKKREALGALPGLAVELSWMLPLAAVWLGWQIAHNDSSSLLLPDGRLLLLCGTAGIVTVVPLLLFIYGAKRIPMSATGLLQYLAPTVKFIIAAFLFGEPFGQVELLSFVAIWVALAIYTADNWRSLRLARQAPAESPG